MRFFRPLGTICGGDICAALRINVSDDVFQRRILDGDVSNWSALKNRFHNLFYRNDRGVDIQFDRVTDRFKDLHSRQTDRLRRLMEFDAQHLGPQELATYARHLIVDHHPSMVNDDHTFSHMFDVSGIMTGQEDSQSFVAIPFANQVAQLLASDNV